MLYGRKLKSSRSSISLVRWYSFGGCSSVATVIENEHQVFLWVCVGVPHGYGSSSRLTGSNQDSAWEPGFKGRGKLTPRTTTAFLQNLVWNLMVVVIWLESRDICLAEWGTGVTEG